MGELVHNNDVISSMSGVDLTSISTNDIIKYNGTNFVKQTIQRSYVLQQTSRNASFDYRAGIISDSISFGGIVPFDFVSLVESYIYVIINSVDLFTFTANASSNTLQYIAHGLINNDLIYCTSSGSLPSPLQANTLYHVVNANTDDFKVSLTQGGSAIDITDTGSGTHQYYRAGSLYLKSSYSSIGNEIKTNHLESGDNQIINPNLEKKIIRFDASEVLTSISAGDAIGVTIVDNFDLGRPTLQFRCLPMTFVYNAS